MFVINVIVEGAPSRIYLEGTDDGTAQLRIQNTINDGDGDYLNSLLPYLNNPAKVMSFTSGGEAPILTDDVNRMRKDTRCHAAACYCYWMPNWWRQYVWGCPSHNT